jgi:hypothetical protein
MTRTRQDLEALIQGLGTADFGRMYSRWELPAVVAFCGLIYGAFMGSFSAYSFERSPLILYVAIKVPLLIFATSLICLPGFFTLNAVLGLQADFAHALRAIAAAQAALTLALASLGPITSVFYLSGITHDGALMLNALIFLVATLAGQSVMRRRYADLIAHPERGPRHRLMLWVWTLLYAFVGMQMGWMLRPFVGSHDLPVAFFRAEPFSNAYVAILHLFFGS